MNGCGGRGGGEVVEAMPWREGRTAAKRGTLAMGDWVLGGLAAREKEEKRGEWWVQFNFVNSFARRPLRPVRCRRRRRSARGGAALWLGRW